MPVKCQWCLFYYPGACAPTVVQLGHLISADRKRGLKARDRSKQLAWALG
jgi:hypothetical protein